jgi:lipopolysaccharide transport system ATP-binding protein
MGNIAIRVEGVSKKYRLGVFQHDTLRDRIAHGVASLLSKSGDSNLKDERVLWALREVSFEVNHGEIVGLIGRNGAGKSTLLKILSRITEPTTGRIELSGRVGSLLEVGTGFHPELSGRENIFLNGSILGMRREEIKRKFDEIVAFAEIERFLDTPVKRYSSGMYVRLAFSVAAHLEPEILLVDEVLAVGDVAFQRKSLGKMGEVAGQGRTVIFVSHNMGTIQTLCDRGIFLRHGHVHIDATIQETVAEYLRTLEDSSQLGLSERTERRGKGQIRLTNISVAPKGITVSSPLATGHPAQFIFYLSDIKPGITCGFTIYDHHGQPIVDFNSIRHSLEDLYDPAVGQKVICELDELLLVPGRYRLDFAVWSNHELQDHVEAAAFFDVTEGRLRDRPAATTNKWGSALMPHRWMVPVDK